VLTIGNFDGVHLGHQAILRAGRERADAAGASLVVLTFEPPPGAVLAPEQPPERIVPAEVKHRLLLEAGADRVAVAPADAGLLAMGPERFVREVLIARLRPRCIVEGPNFHFGRGRAGSIETLRAMTEEGGFEVVEVGPVTRDGDERVSSSLIRDLIRRGDVAAAGECLGRAYVLHGRVVSGERRGRLLAFPTANVAPAAVLTPGDGVYAARADLAGRTSPAAVSIGTRPTFGPAPRAVEVHLLDAAGDFYGQDIAVTLLRRLREQRKFPDAGALREQIAKDIERVREIVG